MIRHYKIFVPILFILILTNALFAQNTKKSIVPHDDSVVKERNFSREQLIKFYKDSNFSYDREPSIPVTIWQKIFSWLGEHILAPIFSEHASIFWKIAGLLLVGGAIFFIITQLLKIDIRGIFYQSGTQQLSAKFFDGEQDLQELDFDELIKTEIKNNNYRSAVRLLYLKVLKELTNKNLIQWKINKTNHDYIDEISDSKLKQPFEEITFIFEYIWYGNFSIDKVHFQHILNNFQNFNRYES